MLAGCDSFEHQRLGNAVATDQLDDDIDVWVGDDGARVVHHLYVGTDDALGTCHIKVSHHGDFDTAAGTALDFLLVALEHVECAASHGANAEQAYLYRFHIVLT
jgi:hypothetical protein